MKVFIYEVITHIQEQKKLYLLIIFLLILGISCGIVTATRLDIEKSLRWGDALGGNLSSEQGGIFLRALLREGRIFGFLILCGLGYAGIPVALLLVSVRGFLLGFSIGFLMGNFGLNGFWLAFVAVLPQNIIIISALLFATVIAVRSAINRKWGRPYWFSMGGAFLVALIGVGFETLLSMLLPGIV